MNRHYYAKLAANNIRKNGRFYYPYMLTCIFTIAMFYMMSFISEDKSITSIDPSIVTIMLMGNVVIGIFSTIFLFYTNSFLMKRRKKEFGLYNILGMEKKHIGLVMFIETVYVIIITMIIGMASGIVFSKLALMLLSALSEIECTVEFRVSTRGIIVTTILYCGIYFLILLYNFIVVRRSKPVELLSSDKAGEREPKTKILMTLFGIVVMLAGYYLATFIESPIEALNMFFIAVILVIAGTYALFTSGSIAFLKILRKNKKFYYKTSHFVSVSGMLYRMKQNAVGLANICILSTMILVILACTVSLYFGEEDVLNTRFAYDMSFNSRLEEGESFDDESYTERIESLIADNGVDIEELHAGYKLEFAALIEGNTIELVDLSSNFSNSINMVYLLTCDDYNRMREEDISLDSNEIYIYGDVIKDADTVKIHEEEYNVKGYGNKSAKSSSYEDVGVEVEYIVVSDMEQLYKIYENQCEVYGDRASSIDYVYSADISGTDDEKKTCFNNIMAAIEEDTANGANYMVTYGESKQNSKESFYSLYGGLLFLGLFLGALFLMATVLIIYYKQISEGYDDRERFIIMQKVGMNKYEVKKAIKSQILLVFMIPVVTASIHVAVAFKMLTKLLAILNLTNVQLFTWCTIIIIAIFIAIYIVIYGVTSKVYYKIVEAK